MALCKLCHWSFDEGLMSVGTKFELLVSKAVNTNQNYPGHIMTLSDRAIKKPEKIDFWPKQKSFEWHREKVFFANEVLSILSGQYIIFKIYPVKSVFFYILVRV